MGSRRTARRRRPSQAATMQASGFAHHDGEHDDEEEAEAACQPSGAPMPRQTQCEQGKEDVDAQLDAHPTAQRN